MAVLAQEVRASDATTATAPANHRAASGALTSRTAQRVTAGDMTSTTRFDRPVSTLRMPCVSRTIPWLYPAHSVFHLSRYQCLLKLL